MVYGPWSSLLISIFISNLHMLNRRKFLHSSLLGSTALLFSKSGIASNNYRTVKNNPIVISTWAPNVKANEEAWLTLGKGGRSIDAVEAGVQIPEADPSDQ